MRNNINDSVDLSFMLYQKYFSLTNREIEITFKGNIVLTGKFFGFFRGEEDSSDPYITK